MSDTGLVYSSTYGYPVLAAPQPIYAYATENTRCSAITLEEVCSLLICCLFTQEVTKCTTFQIMGPGILCSLITEKSALDLAEFRHCKGVARPEDIKTISFPLSSFAEIIHPSFEKTVLAITITIKNVYSFLTLIDTLKH